MTSAASLHEASRRALARSDLQGMAIARRAQERLLRRLRRIPRPAVVNRLMVRLLHRREVIPLDRVLLGGENGLDAAEYARATDDLLRPSTPISRWPHVELLSSYLAHGEEVLDRDRFSESSYLANARSCVDATGHYFGATADDEIRAVARDFVLRFAGEAPGIARPAQSGPRDPVRVRPIRRSDCYEVVDGHHRLAARYVNGATDAEVLVQRRKVWTPLQLLLREMSWLDGRIQLYQPLDAPEVRDWPLVRRCADRLGRMKDFLAAHDLLGHGRTYLDVACCYGWFLGEMEKLGFVAHGIERDPLGVVLASMFHGVESNRISVGDCVEVLEASEEVYDVVSCFSLLHHFVLGRGSAPPEHLAGLLDRATGRVLFLDTGQGHEAWFQRSLGGWDADYIEEWLRRNTTFDEIHRLGADDDAIPPFEGNYGRMLFACMRSG